MELSDLIKMCDIKRGACMQLAVLKCPRLLMIYQGGRMTCSKCLMTFFPADSQNFQSMSQNPFFSNLKVERFL